MIDVTADEHAELRSLQLLDADGERLVWGTYRENDGLVLFGTAEDIDNLACYVAFEANHMTDRRRQRRLDVVLGRRGEHIPAASQTIRFCRPSFHV